MVVALLSKSGLGSSCLKGRERSQNLWFHHAWGEGGAQTVYGVGLLNAGLEP